MSKNSISGIYQIINTRTKRMYIGMSHNINIRFSTHLRELRQSKHSSIKFQYAWDMSSDKDEFKLNVLETFNDNISNKEKREIETKYIIHFASDLFGYNMINNTEEHLYNRKYDINLYEKFNTLNSQICWNRHCILNTSGDFWRSKLPNQLIRASIESPNEKPSKSEYINNYCHELLANLSWLNKVNEYEPPSVVKWYVPPICDMLYRITKFQHPENSSCTYILKFKQWFENDIFWGLVNKFKEWGGEFRKDSNDVSFTYNPSKLPLVDIITKAVYSDETERQRYLEYHKKIETAYLS